MFSNTFQSGFVSIFYSVGSNPLALWDKQVKNGHIRRIVDDEVKSLVLEVSGSNVATTYITCPIKPRASLGITLPFLVMIIKNMKKYFTFEIQILDDKDMHRRFRVSNFQSTTKVRPFCTTMPIGLSAGWNQVQFNLADFTKRAYGSTYLETTRVQIHANVRIRRLYFSDRLYADDEMPNEFKLFLPIPGTQAGGRGKGPIAKKPSQDKSKGKKTSDQDLKIQLPEQEIPSGAPPSPALAVNEALPTVEMLPPKSSIVAEASAELPEVTEQSVPNTGESLLSSENAPSEAAPIAEGEVVAMEDSAPPEEEVPIVETPSAEALPAEQTPNPDTEEEVLPPAEETPEQ